MAAVRRCKISLKITQGLLQATVKFVYCFGLLNHKPILKHFERKINDFFKVLIIFFKLLHFIASQLNIHVNVLSGRDWGSTGPYARRLDWASYESYWFSHLQGRNKKTISGFNISGVSIFFGVGFLRRLLSLTIIGFSTETHPNISLTILINNSLSWNTDTCLS